MALNGFFARFPPNLGCATSAQCALLASAGTLYNKQGQLAVTLIGECIERYEFDPVLLLSEQNIAT